MRMPAKPITAKLARFQITPCPSFRSPTHANPTGRILSRKDRAPFWSACRIRQGLRVTSKRASSTLFGRKQRVVLHRALLQQVQDAVLVGSDPIQHVGDDP